MIQKHAHFIAGLSTESADGARQDLVSPSTGHAYASTAMGSAHDVHRAVSAASAQLDDGPWRQINAEQRGQLLLRLAALVERDTDMLADMDADATGRAPIEPRLLDLPSAVTSFRAAAGWAHQINGRTIPTAGHLGMKTMSYTVRDPVGVVGVILPLHTPIMTASSKLAALLAAGCSMVVKPAKETPQSTLHLARLCQEAGVPDGVVNVVTGLGSVVGRALCEHPGVSKVCFTGSHRSAEAVLAVTSRSLKRVQLELLGSSSQIVFDDASFELALRGCAMSLFINQGQTNASGSRILAQRGIAEELAHALSTATRFIKVGNPRSPGVNMGPLATRSQFERVNHFIESGIREGAELLAGGVSARTDGWFVQPTIFANVSHLMSIARDEVLGPVGAVIPFDSDEQALQMANGSAHASAATVWTEDLVRAHQVAIRLKARAIGVNCWNPTHANLPRTGLTPDDSGTCGGLADVMSCTEEKAITLQIAA